MNVQKSTWRGTKRKIKQRRNKIDYYKIIHPATGKVVNLYSTNSSSAVANGTRLLLYTWLDNNDQKWGLDFVDDLVLMRLARDTSSCIAYLTKLYLGAFVWF